MNDPGFLTIVAWRTASHKRQVQAEKYCKDYGLSRLQPTLCAGRLSFKERREFEEKIKALLSGKRDKLHLFVSCRSCAMYLNLDSIAGHYHTKFFEIV